MNSPTPEEVTEKSLSAESAKPAQTAHTKIEFDAEQIRSSVARLASNSIDDLEKLTSELQQLQQFLKSGNRARARSNRGRIGRNRDHNGNHCSVEKPPASLAHRMLTQNGRDTLREEQALVH